LERFRGFDLQDHGDLRHGIRRGNSTNPVLPITRRLQVEQVRAPPSTSV
jgi:hypothetical protein